MAKKYYLKLRSTPYLSGMILLSIEEIEGITLYLQNLHLYLQLKSLPKKNINLDSLNQFERI